jgi:hypothetical protein
VRLDRLAVVDADVDVHPQHLGVQFQHGGGKDQRAVVSNAGFDDQGGLQT